MIVKKVFRALFILILFAVFIVFSINAYIVYCRIYKPNVRATPDGRVVYFPTGTTYNEALMILDTARVFVSFQSFKWIADRTGFASHVHPGRYVFKQNMSNKEVLTMLKLGRQKPVRFVIHNIRDVQHLCSLAGRKLEIDSSDIADLLFNEQFIQKYGFNQYTLISAFIPNTYELWWTTTADKFFDRMYIEYRKFWNNDRLAKAKKMNLTPAEVSTLASIVEQETLQPEELPVIAGVYINRLKRRIKLQADPTIRYLVSDTIRRVLNRHLTIPSPYNTYVNYGLPPGPISCPSIKALDAVLDYQRHDYLYFCADENLSGRHNFSRTLSQHEQYARKYRQALNKKRIWR